MVIKTLLKIGYGTIFIVIVPALLAIWSKNLDLVLHLPMPELKGLGEILFVFGVTFMIWAMLALRVYGNGLPMNAFPPMKFVRQSIYRITPHPIYVGFSLCIFGTALWLQSASGFWIVAPTATLATIALTLGYERLAIRERFGTNSEQTFLRLPLDSDDKRDGWDILSALILTGLTWFFAYQSALFWGKSFGGVDLSFAFEKEFPVFQWTTVFYSFTYLFVFSVPFLLRSKLNLRKFMVSGNLATVLGILVFFTLPITAPPRPFIPDGFFGELLNIERNFDGASAAFPSFHVLWAFLSARILSQEFPRQKWIWHLIFLSISFSCFTTGMHTIADIFSGILLGIFCAEYRKVWISLLKFAEHIANSWKEWHCGSVRVINHGVYAGLSTMFGALIINFLTGGKEIVGVAVITLSAMLGAALWAQVVEGSASLLRPFGYYGAIVGSVLSCFIWNIFGGNAWQLLAAFTVSAPSIQAIGRIRCLVQGCCHGSKNTESFGIKVSHPSSRIYRLAKLNDINLYPTQVYSIVWNILLTPILFRLWFAEVSPTCIIGVYLLLSSIGRFVEEGYRGEPQTHSFGGLRLYQWLSVGFALIGGVLITINLKIAFHSPELTFGGANISIFLGAIAFFALGVDFPHSSKRFSRLT